MSTTLIIVELLIVGYQVLVWVILLLGWRRPDLVPLKELRKAENLKALAPLLTTFLIATAYTFGVVGDRFLGHLSTEIQSGLGRQPCPPPGNPVGDFCLTKISLPHAYDYFETSSRQVRLLRATGVNSTITLAVLLALWYRKGWKIGMLVPLLLLFLAIASFWTWWMTHETLTMKQNAFYNAWRTGQEVSTNAVGISDSINTQNAARAAP